MIYTGIGSRTTPAPTLRAMMALGRFMAKEGHVLRSGAAPGADTAFETGARAEKGECEIYLPYKLFRQHPSLLFGDTVEDRNFTSKFHPNWANVGSRGRDYLTRNMYQILGRDRQTPTRFMVCWTDDGKVKGGTAIGIRICQEYKIPFFNLGSMSLDEANEKIQDLL